MKSIIKQKIVDWIFLHISFPNRCKTGNELNWMLKNNCPVCISEPIESLSNYEYHKKYPAHNRIQIGVTTVYLCDVHLRKLKETLNNDV